MQDFPYISAHYSWFNVSYKKCSLLYMVSSSSALAKTEVLIIGITKEIVNIILNAKTKIRFPILDELKLFMIVPFIIII